MIDNEEQLMIAASDNGMLWDRDRFELMKQDCDCLVWTFRGNNTVVKKPQAYGWIECDSELNIKKASVN